MMKAFFVIMALTFYIEPTSSITCQTCKMGTSYDDCLKKSENYDCNRIGRTFSYCSIECNKDIWKFACATPSHCSINKRNCDSSRDCGVTCCQGSLCISSKNITHNPCSEGLSYQASAIVIGACALIGLYIR